MGAARRAAVFLDRDGTLIEDVGYPHDPDRVAILPGTVAALGRLATAGLPLVVVSNQSGVGRGVVTAAQAAAVHERFAAAFAAAGIAFAGAYYCPHAPGDGCRCRKPEPGMLRDAAAELGLSLSGSYTVGDKASDVEAGRRAGCRTVLVNAAVAADGADLIAADWSQAVDFILDSKAPA